MLTLTLELIRDNPWNAVRLTLPKKIDKMLYKAALAAVAYCRSSEFAFVVATNEISYEPPPWWRSSSKIWADSCALTFSQEVEERWWAASNRYIKLLAMRKELYEPDPSHKEEAYL